MSRKVIKLAQNGGWYRKKYSCFARPQIQLCTSRTRHHVDIPRDAKNLAIVFTSRARADSFEISQRGGLRDIREFILAGTREMFNAQRKAGRPYLHFEYDA